jgi:hypothetical protein
MSHPAVAILESALRARKLDCTLTTALQPGKGAGLVAPTGAAALDAVLAGGLPRGELSEIAGARSAGRTTLLLRTLAAATQRGEIAAVVDTFDRLDVACVVAAGVDLDRLLWIRGHDVSRPQTSGPGAFFDRVIEHAIKAFGLVLQSGGFGVAAIDLADAAPAALSRLPFTTWMRIHRAIEGSETACVIVGPQPIARSAGGLTLSLEGVSRWAGGVNTGARRFAGVDVTVRVVSPRRRVEGEVTVGATFTDHAVTEAQRQCRGDSVAGDQ